MAELEDDDDYNHKSKCTQNSYVSECQQVQHGGTFPQAEGKAVKCKEVQIEYSCQKPVDYLHKLPSNTLVADLDATVCGKTRTGLLCSRCREGYAANYHDFYYECKEVKDDCKWGWLLYIVSELLPLTIFFCVLMILDVKITDGAISGFILFVQMTDTMHITADHFIVFPKCSYYGLVWDHGS